MDVFGQKLNGFGGKGLLKGFFKGCKDALWLSLFFLLKHAKSGQVSLLDRDSET